MHLQRNVVDDYFIIYLIYNINKLTMGTYLIT